MTWLLTFDTTHHALWAESLARERAAAAELVPAPPESGAGCDLALEVLEEDAAGLAHVLREAGVEFRRYR
jgi:hypothetical protein